MKRDEAVDVSCCGRVWLSSRAVHDVSFHDSVNIGCLADQRPVSELYEFWNEMLWARTKWGSRALPITSCKFFASALQMASFNHS